MCVLFFLLTSPVYPKMHCVIYMFMSTFLLAHLTKITVTLCRKIFLTKKKLFHTRCSIVFTVGNKMAQKCTPEVT